MTNSFKLFVSWCLLVIIKLVNFYFIKIGLTSLFGMENIATALSLCLVLYDTSELFILFGISDTQDRKQIWLDYLNWLVSGAISATLTWLGFVVTYPTLEESSSFFINIIPVFISILLFVLTLVVGLFLALNLHFNLSYTHKRTKTSR